jgi:acyl carrier protein
VNEDYELKVLRMVINQYLDQTVSSTKESLQSLEANRDKTVWELATRIYSQSGHKVELGVIRDMVNSRIRAIEYQLAAEKEQVVKPVHYVSEQEQIAEKAYRARVAGVLGKFGGNQDKAKIFVEVQKIISEHLQVGESEVNLDCHLSNHLGADGLDLIELVMILEEEFDIEISDTESEDELDISSIYDVGTSWSSGSGSSYSSFRNAGEKCTVRNFVELIYKKI